MSRWLRIRRWGWGVVAVLVLAGAAWALRPAPLELDLVLVSRGAVAEEVRGDGRTRVRQLYVVSTPVDGELERIGLRAGDPVEAGQPVARVWPAASRPLDPRARADARAAVEAARAAMAGAEAREEEARVALDHARSKLDQSRLLAAGGAIPAREGEHQEHEVVARGRALEAARAAARQARGQLARAFSAFGGGELRGRAPAATVVAPASGRALRILRESAGLVAAGTPLLEIGDVGQLEVVAELLSSDAAQVSAGAAARLTGWGGPELAARVRTVEPVAFTKISALGLEEQRVRVLLDLVDPPPPQLGHDYRVEAAMMVNEAKDVLRVPATALFRSGERWAVYVVERGRARAVTVEVGPSDGAWTAVRAGLGQDAMVIAQPSDTVQEGTAVSPRPPSTPTGTRGR